MQPDLYELNVETGDRLLLCSDGICGMIEDHEIASIMRQAPSAQSCADQLVEAALAAGGFDNATAVVVDVEGFKAVREKKQARKSKALAIGVIVCLLAALACAVFAGYYYVNNSAYLIEQDDSKKQIISLQPINKRLRFKKAILQAIAPLLMPPIPQKPTTLRAILGQIPVQILTMQKTPKIPTTPSVVNSL